MGDDFVISQSNVADINNLLRQLSANAKPVDGDAVKRLVSSGGYLFAARDKEKIVGMATLTCSFILTAPFGHIDDVIVDKEHEGRGTGAALMRGLIAKARELGLKRVELTSRPSRKRANRFYKKLGFRLAARSTGKGGTNLYRLDIADIA